MASPSNFTVSLPPEGSQSIPVSFTSEEIRAIVDRPPSPSQAELDKQMLRPLHPDLDQAIESGNVDCVLEELNRARCRFHPQATFDTAVERAIVCRRLDVVRLLMDEGIPVSLDHLEGAARAGHVPILAHVMDHLGWQINRITHHRLTILTLAVKHKDMVVWLLSQGADIELADDYGGTPLSRAVEKGALSVVNLLLEAGADITRGSPLGASLLREEENADLELTRQLLACGAPVNKFTGENSSIWWEAPLEQKTPLHTACSRSHRNLAAVRLFLAHGADPTLNIRVRNEEIPNTSALDYARALGFTDIAAAIQEYLENSNGSGKANL